MATVGSSTGSGNWWGTTYHGWYHHGRELLTAPVPSLGPPPPPRYGEWAYHLGQPGTLPTVMVALLIGNRENQFMPSISHFQSKLGHNHGDKPKHVDVKELPVRCIISYMRCGLNVFGFTHT